MQDSVSTKTCGCRLKHSDWRGDGRINTTAHRDRSPPTLTSIMDTAEVHVEKYLQHLGLTDIIQFRETISITHSWDRVILVSPTEVTRAFEV